MTPLIVVYGLGSATPVDLLRSAGDDIEVRLVVDPDDEHTRQVAPLLDFAPHRLAMTEADLTAAGTDPPPYLADAAGIVTFSERMLPRTARLAAALGLAGHSPEVAVAVTDKAVQRELLAASPRLSAQHVRLDEVTSRDEIPLPGVVKPVRGEGGRHVRLLRTPADVDKLLAAPPSGPVLVEEYLPDGGHPAHPAFGSYVSVEAFVVDGRPVHWGLTDKLRPWPPFFETGSIAPSSLPDADATAVRDVVDEALRLLGVRLGCVHVECKLTPDGPRVIEVNGRLGGSVAKLMRATRGWDAVRSTMDVALGREPVPPKPPTSCAVVVHVPADQPPRPIAPRLRERLRAIAGVTAVDTPFANRVLLGADESGPHRLVDLTIEALDPADLWRTLADAVAVLVEGGMPTAEGFADYVAELRAS